MAIRRFREHVADQNWFAVLIDVGIVVLGVFLGIQASNWNSSRLERGEARAYRAQIIDNLRSNERQIAARDKYYRQVRNHSRAALEKLGQRGDDDAFLIDAYQASQVWPIILDRSAYDELIASGMAKNFASPKVRERLSAYYAGMPAFQATAVGTTAYREQLRREMKFMVQDRMRQRCNDVFTPAPDGIQVASLPDRCSLGLSEAVVSSAAAKLRSTPQLEQNLTRHIGDLDQKIDNFGRWAERARELRLELDRMQD